MSRYLGRRTAWERILDPEGERTPQHSHTCPECHWPFPCRMDCELDSKLDGKDGSPFGSPRVCVTCARPHTKFPGGRIFTDTPATAGSRIFHPLIIVYS